MNDKTETQALVDLLGAITDRMVPGSLTAEAIAKASLQLHDQAEEIERLKAEVAALKDAAHYAKGTADLAIRHRDEAEALVSAARGALSDEIALAIQHSRNFATAKPGIGPTEREHILGLCMLLERTLLQRSQAKRYADANPLGGPAKVFEAVASRIRAGENLADVMDDYGLAWTAERASD